MGAGHSLSLSAHHRGTEMRQMLPFLRVKGRLLVLDPGLGQKQALVILEEITPWLLSLRSQHGRLPHSRRYVSEGQPAPVAGLPYGAKEAQEKVSVDVSEHDGGAGVQARHDHTDGKLLATLLYRSEISSSAG